MSGSVSVVMAVFNGSRFLRQQVDSVLAQLEGDDELLVVDDASTDDSVALLRAIGSQRIKIHCNPVNAGVRLTFQRGLQLARHDIIFLCDQDDVWLPGKRNAFVAAFAACPSAAVVLSDAEVIDAEGRVVAPSYIQGVRGGFDGSIFGTIWRNRYLGCAMAIHRRILPSALPIPADAPMHDMWLGLLGRLSGAVVYLPTPYLRYRRHGGNATSSQRQPISRMARWRVALALALARRWLTIAFRGDRGRNSRT